MTRLAERVFDGIELLFWRLAVRALSFSRPISKRALEHAKELQDGNFQLRVRVQAPDANGFASATVGWCLGILLGYLIAVWAF